MTTPAHGLLGPADIRRAAALLVHTDPDGTLVDGVNAILTEARDAGRITELFLALSAVVYGIHPELSTQAGQSGLQGIIAHHLALETNGETPRD